MDAFLVSCLKICIQIPRMRLEIQGLLSYQMAKLQRGSWPMSGGPVMMEVIYLICSWQNQESNVLQSCRPLEGLCSQRGGVFQLKRKWCTYT